MKKIRFKLLLIMFVLVLLAYPTCQVQAKVQDFSTFYLELNVPDDTIVLTKDTPNDDNQWYKAGITDPKTEKKGFASMGVQAILYDPDTNTTVRLLQKQSKDSREVFNLSLLSAEELTKFLNGLFTSNNEKVTSTVEEYPQAEAAFFRLCIEMIKDNVPSTEVIYGTIVNGYSITFDLYKGNSAPPIEESYIKELVAGVHFTEFLDKTEVEKQERKLSILVYVCFALIITLLLVWFLVHKHRRNKKQALKIKKSEMLEKFFKVQKHNEELDIFDAVLFVNRTEYSEGVIKTFCYYNKIFKSLKLWVISALFYVVLLVSLYYSSSSFLYYLVALIILFAFIYYQGFLIEKSLKQLIAPYKNNKNMEAVFTFYEDYYTLSGIQSISKYPYLQITEINEYKGYIYIYLATGTAVYLKKDGFEQEAEDFIRFIKQQIIK